MSAIDASPHVRPAFRVQPLSPRRIAAAAVMSSALLQRLCRRPEPSRSAFEPTNSRSEGCRWRLYERAHRNSTTFIFCVY